ncbi:MAG: cell surface protein [Candidatus Hydrogenedentes bacterium]|nr:cell surface protein [Candidatus Hydrogenedentota bacterium]
MIESVHRPLWRAAAIAAVFCVGALSAAWAEQGYLSPLAVVADPSGAALYVAEAGASRIDVVDMGAGNVARSIPLPASPAGLAVAPDGARLYAAVGGSGGQVIVLNPADGAVVASVPVGHTPVSPVVSPDGKTLYVCTRFGNRVDVIDLGTNQCVASIPVLREPFAAALTPDGGMLFVVNHLPAGPSDGDYVSAVVSVIDTASRQAVAAIQLPNGSTGLRGICISPDGQHAYVTHVLARYQLPTTQLERGWMNTNALSIIDVAGPGLINTVLLDDVDAGAANPWGVACTADGAFICVAHAGTHEISVIDRAALHEKLDKVAAGEDVSEVSKTPEDVPNDLAFLVGMRRRLKLAGNGPRGLAVLGTTAYAAEYFTGSLGVLDISPDGRGKAQSMPLGEEPPITPARLGERYFNDAAFCFQNWQSCASCHPDVRADGLNWDLLNDGMGNPKNTKSLVLSHRTPPVMITGVRDRAEIAVRAGIKYIQFAVRPEEDAVAIDEFLKSVNPEPSPYLENGQLSEAARRGRDAFQKARCDACHPGALSTDMEMHDVGTGVGREEGRAFDTPTLAEVWRTAPFLYDGRSATLKEVLTIHNVDDRHGVTSRLTEQEISDLAAFVLSL